MWEYTPMGPHAPRTDRLLETAAEPRGQEQQEGAVQMPGEPPNPVLHDGPSGAEATRAARARGAQTCNAQPCDVEKGRPRQAGTQTRSQDAAIRITGHRIKPSEEVRRTTQCSREGGGEGGRGAEGSECMGAYVVCYLFSVSICYVYLTSNTQVSPPVR